MEQNKRFVAGLGSYYFEGELHEVLRICSDKISQENLQKLQELFQDKPKQVCPSN